MGCLNYGLTLKILKSCSILYKIDSESKVISVKDKDCVVIWRRKVGRGY